ncbi:MAG TPA: two-component regulator propeller domain-containing protein, partial [Candidatus Aminicenantes bacterium]|nr:two-component regulator propeller domain-containing protein [Candidatus Aminicenantes bacterium]
MRKSLFLLLVLGWCFSLPASRLPMVVFRTQDGLPQNRISALAQDRLGRLWIGTQSGAARYDGVEFVTYTVRNGLAGNSILRLLSGPEGSVFVVTAQGIDRISERGTLDRTLTPSDPIRDACLSADG